MNRWVKRAGVIVLIPVILIVLVSVLLYLPPFQNFVKDKAMVYASRATGMDIAIGKVRLAFPLNLSVRDVQVISPPADTLLTLRELTVSVKLLPLLRQDVQVNAVRVRDVALNSGALIPGMTVQGALGNLYLKADHINLASEQALVNTLELADTDISLLLSDTAQTKQDTTSAPVNWKLLLHDLRLSNVSVRMQLPGDTVRMYAFVREGMLEDGSIDLAQSRYGAGRFTLSGSSVSYDSGSTPVKAAGAGFDPSHIALQDIHVALDSVLNRGMEIQALFGAFSCKERSGLEVVSLTGKVRIDSTRIDVPDLELATPYSRLSLSAAGSTKAIDSIPSGEAGAILSATVGKKDLLTFLGPLPGRFAATYPEESLMLQVAADGNLDHLSLRSLQANLPGAFELHATGEVSYPIDSLRRQGEIRLDAETGHLYFLLAAIDTTGQGLLTLPSGIRLNGQAQVDRSLYRATLAVTEGKGRVNLVARYDTSDDVYAADLTVDSLQLDHFLPKDSLRSLSASVSAEGKGTDLFSPATYATLQGRLDALQYGTLPLSGIRFDGSLRQSQVHFALHSSYQPAMFQVRLDGSIRKDKAQGTLAVQAQHIDPYRLHLMQDSLATSFLFHLEAESNLRDALHVDGSVKDWKIRTARQQAALKDVAFLLHTAADTTGVRVQAGDLTIRLDGNNGLEGLGKKFSHLSQALSTQLRHDTIDLQALRPLLPRMGVHVAAGKDNPLYNFLSFSNIRFESLRVGITSSPQEGILGGAGIYSLQVDTLQLDTVRFTLDQDREGIRLDGGLINNAQNKQHVFSAGLQGRISDNDASVLLQFTGAKGETGLLLGCQVRREKGDWRFHFYPNDPVVAFRPFTLNADNYVRLGKDKKITADFEMQGLDGAALLFRSKPLQGTDNELELELRRLDLSLLSGLNPYMPQIGGKLQTHVDYIAKDSTFHVTARVGVDSLAYEKQVLGDILLTASYLPGAGQSHHIDAHLFHDRLEVLTATGAYYQSAAKDSLRSDIEVKKLPLRMANPFIPDGMARVGGALEGKVAVNGSLDRPVVDGYINFDTASVFVAMVGASFQLDEKRIGLQNSRLLFDRYGIYTSGKNPFVVNGWIDASDPAKMLANLDLSADNLELLNVKRNDESLVYGKMYVDLTSTVRGPFDNLVMRGNLRLLGNTDMTYVLKDSPLTVQDRLAGLVTFVDFADTAQVKNEENQPLQLSGVDILMTVEIDQAVRLKADLSEDRESRVELEGGGDLSFQYTPQGDMILNGRYTLSGGTIKYALPVIPSKTFSVNNGSYVEWNGNIADPTLNITAVERVRTSVAMDDQSPRMVNFDVSIVVKNQLEDLSLTFDLSAPQDLSVQDQLASKSAEERSKLAVAMLVSNMYLLSDGNGKMNMDMGSALSSFLQHEINNLAGSALPGVDVSFGVENYDGNGEDGGGQRTDYSFSFSKRFYNDRIRVIIGGRISTGNPDESNQTFIDNISVEYRLDASGTRYIKVFHDKNYESILEGEVTETGAGLVLRKKMRKLRELFIFRKQKKQLILQRTKP